MDSVIAVDVSPREGLIVAIFRLARRYARRITTPDSADDVAHDVVLECLVKWQNVRRAVVVQVLPDFVRHLVHRRCTESVGLERRTKESELEHGRALLERERKWMDPAAFEVDDEEPSPSVLPVAARPTRVPTSMRPSGARRRRRDGAPMGGAA